MVLVSPRFVLTVLLGFLQHRARTQPWHSGSFGVLVLLLYLPAILDAQAGLPYDFEDTLK